MIEELLTDEIEDIILEAIRDGYKEIHTLDGTIPPFGIPISVITKLGEKVKGKTASLSHVGPLDLHTVAIIYNYETLEKFSMFTLDQILLWKEIKA
jgi:hypothetical protein